jgi:hypothetical protein
LCSPESIVPFRFSRWSWHTEGLNRISYDDGENGSLNINQSKQPSRTKSAKDILGLIGEWEQERRDCVGKDELNAVTNHQCVDACAQTQTSSDGRVSQENSTCKPFGCPTSTANRPASSDTKAGAKSTLES